MAIIPNHNQLLQKLRTVSKYCTSRLRAGCGLIRKSYAIRSLLGVSGTNNLLNGSPVDSLRAPHGDGLRKPSPLVLALRASVLASYAFGCALRLRRLLYH